MSSRARPGTSRQPVTPSHYTKRTPKACHPGLDPGPRDNPPHPPLKKTQRPLSDTFVYDSGDTRFAVEENGGLGGLEERISNCYIFNASEKNTWIEWNVKTRIDAYWRSTNAGYGQNAQAVLAQDGTWTAEILWQDISATAHNSITVEQNKTKDGVVLKMQDTDMRGNVVVAVKRSGVILWSWHIWITDYNPDAIAKENGEQNGTNTAYTSSKWTGELHRYSGTMWESGGELYGKYIMDRNIGALDTAYPWTSNGGKGSLYYQFGRKDPFPAATTTDGTTSAAWRNGSTWVITTAADHYVSQSTPTNMREAVYNPLKFYGRGAVAANNWCSEATAETIPWNDITKDNLTGKSIFDPSPAGWKVPTTGVWSAATISTFSSSVATFFTNASYPACGTRSYTSAAMNYVGTYGRYWSSTPNSETLGYNFYFSSGYVYPAYSNYRSYGYSVRAVQE